MSTATVRNCQKLPFFQSEISSKRTLLLDYDGTLAPFIVDRDHACPYDQIPALLDEISHTCDTHIAIVTGREADEIPFLLRTKQRLEVWGCHGLERVHTDGRYWRATIDQEAEESLQLVSDRLRGCGLAGRTESKPGSIAVHWRGLTPKYSEEVKSSAYRSFGPLAGKNGLHIREFDQGLELCVRASNKGKVVETVLAEMGQGAAIAYLGDDISDEDAFRALNGQGITIRVGPKYRFSSAQFWLRPPDEVIWFLRDWISACKDAE
jgi:trehalose 6-phosphate phosphatase